MELRSKCVLIHKHSARQVESVLVYENAGVPASATKMVAGRDKWWASEMEPQPTVCPVEWVDAEHPLFLLYTSGSTGGLRRCCDRTKVPASRGGNATRGDGCWQIHPVFRIRLS